MIFGDEILRGVATESTRTCRFCVYTTFIDIPAGAAVGSEIAGPLVFSESDYFLVTSIAKVDYTNYLDAVATSRRNNVNAQLSYRFTVVGDSGKRLYRDFSLSGVCENSRIAGDAENPGYLLFTPNEGIRATVRVDILVAAARRTYISYCGIAYGDRR